MTRMLAFVAFGLLVLACGKSGGGGKVDPFSPKPQLGVPAGEGAKPKPTDPALTPKPSEPSEPVLAPTSPAGSTTAGEAKPQGGLDKFPNAVKGLWALSIAQKPRACSSIYDLRDSRSLSLHVLCPGDKGRSVSLQTESFTRVSDDGQKALFRRVDSTCGVSPTTAGSVFIDYRLDAKRKLTLNEGAKSSPALDPLPESNYAADLKTAMTVHGRPIVRGCFRSGNLQNFDATRIAR